MSAEPPPPPRLSPDGKFYWDGERWVPMPDEPSALPAKPLPNRIGAGLVIGGAALAVIGCFLPWISATAPFIGTVTRDAISSPDGEVIASIAGISALVGVVVWVRRVGLVVPIALLVAAAIDMWVFVIDYQDLSGRIQGLSGNNLIVAEIGVGAYLTGFGVVTWAVGAVVSFRQKR